MRRPAHDDTRRTRVVRRWRAGLVITLAATGVTAAAAPVAAAAPALINPYRSVQVATTDNGEAVAVWRTTKGELQTAIGRPGEPFSTALTIAGNPPPTSEPAVAMDAAGDVVIVWEAYAVGACDGHGGCETSSLGVFAAIRPAGGPFGPAVRLAQAQPRLRAGPQLAMNRAGDWVVTMSVGRTTVVGAGRRATPPVAFTALPMPGAPQAFALDEAGATTFVGVDSAQQPVTVQRTATGTFVSPQILDGGASAGLGVRIAVGPGGDALAVWPAGQELHWAMRRPGDSFTAPGALGVRDVPASAVAGVGVDAQSRTLTVLPGPGPIATAPLVVLRGTTAAPFAAAETLSEPSQIVASAPTFAFGAGGTAAIGWSAVEGSATSARLSVAFAGGPFAPSLGLGAGAGVPAVAAGGGDHAVAAWLVPAGDMQRVMVASLSPAGLDGVSIAAAAPRTPAPPLPVLPLPNVAVATSGQRLTIRAGGTVRPRLRCVSATTCRGMLRIVVRPAPGRPRVRLGTHRFVLAAGRTRTMTVRATRAARRAALRRTLRGTIAIRTTSGSGKPRTLTVSLSVRRSS